MIRKDLSSNLQIASEFLPFPRSQRLRESVRLYSEALRGLGNARAQGQLLAVLEIPELQQQLELDEAAVRRSEHDLARTQEDLNAGRIQVSKLRI